MLPQSRTSQISSSHMTSSELEKDLYPVQLKQLRQSEAAIVTGFSAAEQQ